MARLKRKTSQPTPTPDQIVDVRTIRAAGGRTLVEWEDSDGLRRAELDTNQIPAPINGRAQVAADMLADAEPYGLAWEDLIELHTSPDQVAAELRRLGFWTAADLRANPARAVEAFAAASRVDLNALVRAVDVHEREQEEAAADGE